MIDEAWARRELGYRETEELVEILAARDEDEWRPEVFPLVEQLLAERGVDPAKAVAEHRRQPQAQPPLEIAEPEAGHPVVLAQLEDEVEAGLCRMALAEQGIEARLRDPDGSGRLELLVDEAKAEAARAVLESAEADGDADADAEEGFRCRSCGFIAEPIREGDRLVCQVCGEEG